MDIDQRLDRLAERHEALTQSVEIFIASTRENFNRLDRDLDRLEKISERNEIRIGQLMEAMNRFINTAEAHEDRLSDVETRLDNLESQS